MNCNYTPEDVLTWLYGEMPEKRNAEFEEHLTGCDTCRELVRRYRGTKSLLDDAPDVPLPEKLSGEIRLRGRAPAWRQAALGGIAVAALLIAVVLTGNQPALGKLQIIPKGMEVTIFSEQGGHGQFAPRQGEQRRIQMITAQQRMTPGVNAPASFHRHRRNSWGLALIKDRRNIVNLPKGRTELSFTDVAGTIDPETVRFESTTDPEAVAVCEQNFEFDLATSSAVLKRYIDHSVEVLLRDGTLKTGKLKSFSGGNFVLGRETGGETEIIPQANVSRIDLASLPEGLVTRPTLRWKLNNTEPGDHETLVAYMASKMKWRADYVVLIRPDDMLDVQGWVTITNQSGASYRRAKLKLMAGDVHRVVERPQQWRSVVNSIALDAAGVGGGGFEEKSFFEYHLYTLGRPATLLDNQTKQLSLFDADGVSAERKFMYDPRKNASRVLISLEFKNEEANQLGMPLPKGRVRMMMNDPDGEQQQVAVDSVDHTPKDEDVELSLGLARGLAVERTKTATRRPSRRSLDEDWRIRLRNHRAEAVDITVTAPMQQGREWKVTAKSHDFEKEDAYTAAFVIPVEPDAEATLTYTIRYTW